MQTIIHIGAGHCSELEAYLAGNAQRIVLVEPIPALAAKLAQRVKEHSHIIVLEAAVSPESASNQLHEYNLQEASSLRAAIGLKRLFPGLKTIKTHTVKTLTPNQLVREYAPEPGQPAMLVIQAPGEELAILQALIDSDQLKRFSHLQITANPEPLYEGSVAAEAIIPALTDYGYDITGQNQQDPDWPSWELQRNPLKDRNTELELQNQQLEQRNSELKAELETRKAESVARQNVEASLKDELKQTLQQLKATENELIAAKKANADGDDARQALQTELNALKSDAEKDLEQATQSAEESKSQLQKIQKELGEHKSWLANRKKQVHELEQKLEKLEATRQQLEQENTNLKAQLNSLEQDKRHLQESQTVGQQALSRLEEKMEQLFHQQSSQLQQAANALGKHVTRQFQNQRQQFQAITGLTQYLESGEQPLEYGGWAIGADLAGHLVRAVENNQYDLIIEFGSGTSTVLLARAVLNTISSTSRQVGKPALEHEASRGSGNRQLQPLEELDLPHRILSFEQDKTYLQQTLNTLTQANLKPLVDLVLAPLVPTSRTTQQGNQVLFYDCEQNLARIAQLYTGRTAKILVLVDGPHSPQGNPLAREPALATLLQYLSAHQLHVVLDDANREGEQQVVRHWQELCEQRGLVFKQTQLDTEKGALWVTVND